MNEKIKEALERQVELLSERSKDKECSTTELVDLTRALVSISESFDRCDRVSFPSR